MIGIVGSGFGLYGYLPAVLLTYTEVVLLNRIKEKFLKRKELECFKDKIVWEENENDFFLKIDTLIIALPPKNQFELIIQKLIHYPNIRNIIMEKPIATNPYDSKYVMKLLIDQQINFRINYSFFYIDWFKVLNDTVFQKKSIKNIDIIWQFKAHHYSNNLFNWKRNNEEGGGVVRFYGIHLLAVAASMGFKSVKLTEVEILAQNDYFSWRITLINHMNQRLNVYINSNSEIEQFVIKYFEDDEKNLLLHQKTPFEIHKKATFDTIDERTIFTKKIIDDVTNKIVSDSTINLYNDIISLWAESESITQYQFLSKLV